MSIDNGVIARLQSINKRLKLNGLLKYGLLWSNIEYLKEVKVLTLTQTALLQIFVKDDESIGSLVEVEGLDLMDGAEFPIGGSQLKLAEVNVHFHNSLDPL